jgi:hypothetical protein
MPCRQFFDANRENREYCKLLQQIPEVQQLAWESLSASEYSPGVVQDDEELVRRVEDPTHFDATTGQIKPTFFDDASSKGASCFRLRHTTVAQIADGARKYVDEINKNPPSTGVRTAIGYTIFSADEVRKVLAPTEPPRRGAAVYDTGLHNDPAHADVCQLVSGKQAGKSVRAQLFLIAKDRLVPFDPPDEIEQVVAAD